MADSPPVLYLLHGNDEYEIVNFVDRIIDQLGDPGAAMMNTTRLEGKIDPGDLARATQAVPFLAKRRVVILKNSLSFYRSQHDRKNIKDLIGNLPQTTALVVVEQVLKSGNWFLKWAQGLGTATYIRKFDRPRGGALVKWVREYAKNNGGEIQTQAASHLVSLIPEDSRIAAMEMDKLLMYTNQERAIDIDDVEMLTASVREGDIFAMVDSIGARDGKRALDILHQLLRDREGLLLFGMIIRQFRLLLLYKEIERSRTPDLEASSILGVRSFVIPKIKAQAKNFDVQDLESVYRQLLELDEQMKTGQVDIEIAMNMLIAGLVVQTAKPT